MAAFSARLLQLQQLAEILSFEEFLRAWHSDKPSVGFKVRINETKFCSTKVDFHMRQLVPDDELLS